MYAPLLSMWELLCFGSRVFSMNDFSVLKVHSVHSGKLNIWDGVYV